MNQMEEEFVDKEEFFEKMGEEEEAQYTLDFLTLQEDFRAAEKLGKAIVFLLVC